MKRLLAGGLLVLLTAAAVYGYLAAGRERTYRQLIVDGDTALVHDNAFAAIEAFSGAILLKPQSMLGYLKRGEAYRGRGEDEAALRDLSHAAELDPAAPRPLEELGDVNLVLRSPGPRYGAAAEYYRSYLRLDDRSPRVLYKLAYARYRDNRPAEAVDALRRALAIRPRFAEADYLLALCLRDTRQAEPARAALLAAISEQPAMVSAREALADLDVTINQPEERLAQLEALARLDPGAAREIALGQGYTDAGRHDRAILTLVRAAEHYPDEPFAYTALGRAWLEIAQAHGDRVALTKATGALQQAIASDQGSEALMLFGRAQLLSGDVAGAERTLEDASRQEPADPLAFYHLADAAERLGHYAAARDALIDYTALAGEDTDARRRSARDVRLAELSMKMNDPASAAVYFEQAAAGSPEAEALRTRAAAARARAGRLAGPGGRRAPQ